MVTLYELLFVTNDSTSVVIFDNETGEMLRHPVTCDDMLYDIDEYADCSVMDVYIEDNLMNICIEV